MGGGGTKQITTEGKKIKGYSPKRYHSKTHVTDEESLKEKEQT
jgi:hypothetical protein